MTEYFTVLQEAPSYEISNYGNVRRICKRATPHYLKPYEVNGSVFVDLFINKKRTKLGLAKLVFKYFGDCEPRKTLDKQVHILHKDGNNWNNKVDNLFVSMYRDQKIERFAMNKYELEAENNVENISNWYIGKLKKYGIDIEELKQQSFILIWRYLPLYVENQPFYNFCMKYVKYAYYNLVGEIIDKNKKEVSWGYYERS